MRNNKQTCEGQVSSQPCYLSLQLHVLCAHHVCHATRYHLVHFLLFTHVAATVVATTDRLLVVKKLRDDRFCKLRCDVNACNGWAAESEQREAVDMGRGRGRGEHTRTSIQGEVRKSSSNISQNCNVSVTHQCHVTQQINVAQGVHKGHCQRLCAQRR